MKITDHNIDTVTTREPMRPHALSWGARYADRNWFSRSKYKNARIRKVGKRNKAGRNA